MTARQDGIARRKALADEIAPQRDNPFKDMTLEMAKADDLWDAIKIKKEEDGSLLIETNIISEIHIPIEVIEDTKGDVHGQIAKLFCERYQLDLLEIEMILKHKLSDTRDAQ